MPIQERIVFRFGNWTVDSLAHSLSNGAVEHQVPAKVMAVLVYLAQNQERPVTRKELIDAVWDGNSYVGDKALNNAIWRIRQVLGRDADDTEFIKTTPKTGYQLVAAPTFPNPENNEIAAAGGSSRSGRYLASIGVVLAFAALAVLYVKDSPGRSINEPLAIVTQLPGRELYAAPSPDGTQFAFMHVSPAGRQDLYIQSLQNPDGQPTPFTSGDTSNFSPTWAADSRHLAYVRIDDQSGVCEVVIRDTGLNEEYAVDVCADTNQRTLSWSPDGQWLVYRKADPELGPGLYLKAMNLNFRPTEELTDRRISCPDCFLTDQEVSWSPNSRFLAVTRTRNQLSEDVYRFDLDEWQYTRLTYGESSIEGHTWDKAGENLLYVSNRHSLNRRIWVVNSATKNKREIGHEGAGFPVYLPDYKSIMFYRRRANAYIAAIPIDPNDLASSFPRAIVQTSGTERNPTYSSSANKLVYYSNVSGHNEIWTSNADGSGRQQLTDLKTNAIYPSWSPSGAKIAFLTLDPNTESTAIKIYDLASNSVDSITTGLDECGAPTWASDGRSLIVPISRGSTEVDLWRVAIDGNQLTRITSNGGQFGRESADGKYIYYSKAGAKGLFQMSLADGSESLAREDIIPSGFGNWTWAGTDTMLYSRINGDHSEVVQYNLATGAQTVVVKHPSRIVHRYGMLSYSARHKLLYFTHREPQQIDILMAPDPLAGFNSGK